MSKLSDIIAIKALVDASLVNDNSHALRLNSGNYSGNSRYRNNSSYSKKLRNRITAKNLEGIKK